VQERFGLLIGQGRNVEAAEQIPGCRSLPGIPGERYDQGRDVSAVVRLGLLAQNAVGLRIDGDAARDRGPWAPALHCTKQCNTPNVVAREADSAFLAPRSSGKASARSLAMSAIA
jgi:hypothetical protein